MIFNLTSVNSYYISTKATRNIEVGEFNQIHIKLPDGLVTDGLLLF